MFLSEQIAWALYMTLATSVAPEQLIVVILAFGAIVKVALAYFESVMKTRGSLLLTAQDIVKKYFASKPTTESLKSHEESSSSPKRRDGVPSQLGDDVAVARLKREGMSAKDLKKAGCTLAQLERVGFTGTDLERADFDFSEPGANQQSDNNDSRGSMADFVLLKRHADLIQGTLAQMRLGPGYIVCGTFVVALGFAAWASFVIIGTTLFVDTKDIYSTAVSSAVLVSSALAAKKNNMIVDGRAVVDDVTLNFFTAKLLKKIEARQQALKEFAIRAEVTHLKTSVGENAEGEEGNDDKEAYLKEEPAEDSEANPKKARGRSSPWEYLKTALGTSASTVEMTSAAPQPLVTSRDPEMANSPKPPKATGSGFNSAMPRKLPPARKEPRPRGSSLDKGLDGNSGVDTDSSRSSRVSGTSSAARSVVSRI